MAIVFGGLDSTGKTYQAELWATAGLDDRKSILLDLEYPRGKKTHSAFFHDKQLDILNCKVLHQKSNKSLDIRRGERDPIKSFELFEHNLETVLDNFELYGCIIIDGISDVRLDYSKVWLKDYNKRKNETRQSIGKDPGAWSDINERIIEMTISPLQELGSEFDTTVIFTSKMADDYKLVKMETGKQDTVKTGTKHIDVHQDIRHIVDTICLLEVDNSGSYYVSIQKSIKGSTGTKLLTKPLYEVLLEAGI